jgi:hypothetical protein
LNKVGFPLFHRPYYYYYLKYIGFKVLVRVKGDAKNEGKTSTIRIGILSILRLYKSKREPKISKENHIRKKRSKRRGAI